MSIRNLADHLRELIDRYWDIAWCEGRDGRHHDNELNEAQMCRSGIESLISKLETGVQEALLISESRKAFENQYDSDYLDRDEDGDYKWMSTRDEWELWDRAWQATSAGQESVIQLSELMRGLEIGPGMAAMKPHGFYSLGKAIAEQAKKAASVPQQWRDTMEELAADLESEIENRRSGDLDRRIERDLIVVREARALLAEQEQGHE